MNNNGLEIFTVLGVSPRGLLLSSIDLGLWGATWILRCIYDPDNPKEFELVFHGCTKYVWEDKSNILVTDVVADVIDILLGEKHHGSPAIIATNLFLIEITYNECSVIKKW